MKKFGYFAAVSVVVLAQAASAQVATSPAQSATPVTNEAVTLKAVTPRSATAAASVTITSGTVWSFDGSGGARVNGVAVQPGKLTEGMRCSLSGWKTITKNTIDTIACNKN